MDMRALQRIQSIDAVLNLRERAVSDLVYKILQGSAFQELLQRLQQTARRHRLMIRAEKLCWDDAAADRLLLEARKLEVDASVVDMDLALQAIEYFLSMRPGVTPAEVAQFCRDRLGVVFTPEQREAGGRQVQPEEATVLFADFDNVLLQVLFAMPENWELTIEELEALRDEE